MQNKENEGAPGLATSLLYESCFHSVTSPGGSPGGGETQEEFIIVKVRRLPSRTGLLTEGYKAGQYTSSDSPVSKLDLGQLQLVSEASLEKKMLRV